MCVVQPRCPRMDSSSRRSGIGKLVRLGEAWAWPKVSEGFLGAALGPERCPHPSRL